MDFKIGVPNVRSGNSYPKVLGFGGASKIDDCKGHGMMKREYRFMEGVSPPKF